MNTWARLVAVLMAPLVWLAGKVESALAVHSPRKAAAFRADVDGFIDMGSIRGLLTTVLVAIVSLLLLGSLAGLLITAIADIVAALETSTTNNTTADTLLPIFGLLVAIGGILAIVGLVFAAFRFRRGRSA